jgi:hypothetical protein
VTRFRSVMRGRHFPAPARPAWICFRVIFVVIGRFQPILSADMVSSVPYPRWRQKVSFASRAPSYRSWPLGWVPQPRGPLEGDGVLRALPWSCDSDNDRNIDQEFLPNVDFAEICLLDCATVWQLTLKTQPVRPSLTRQP